MANAQSFFLGTRMVHGLGAVAGLGGHVKPLGGTKVLLCTDKGLTRRGGHREGRRDNLRRATSRTWSSTTSRRTRRQDRGRRRRCCSRARAVTWSWRSAAAARCAPAKGIALVAANGGTLTDYEGFNKAAGPPFPVIAIPTTAGSGTEVSKVTILTDEARNFKMSILDERTYPEDRPARRRADGQPVRPAGARRRAWMRWPTRLDALWSVGATQFSDALATESSATIMRDLPAAATTDDMAAKQRMLEAELDRQHRPGYGASRTGARALAAARPSAPVARSGDRASCCRTRWSTTSPSRPTRSRRWPACSATAGDDRELAEIAAGAALGLMMERRTSPPVSIRRSSPTTSCRSWWSSAPRSSTTS